MSTQTPHNYARADGIYHSELAAPIVFAIAYIPLFVFNVFRSIRHPTYVFVVLAVFCIIRITAFTMRAILAASDTAGNNLNVVVAQSVLYSVGFFGLLYSAYTLVIDREHMLPKSGPPPPGPLGLILRLVLNAHFVRIILLVAVVLGIIGGVDLASSKASDRKNANTYRHASIIIFLVVVVLLVLLTAKLIRDERNVNDKSADGASPVGRQHRLIVLLGIAVLCMGREIFFAVTLDNTQRQNQASIFYPTAALFELLAVVLFAAPGLVPSRRELAERRDKMDNSNLRLMHYQQSPISGSIV